MRIAIVGTELCAVDAHGGGLEHVLLRWAEWLARSDEVTVLTLRDAVPAPGAPYRTMRTTAGELSVVTRGFDVVSLHNRPQWVARCRAERAVVTFHNYPPAWKTTIDAVPAGTPLSAVSNALAAMAGARLGAPVDVVQPSIDPVFCGEYDRCPDGTVAFPHRLMRKKGVLELLAVAQREEFRNRRFVFADLISPWRRPTADHRALRAAVRATPNARLRAPAGAAELAAWYATAGVVVCPMTEPEGLGLVALEAQACGAPVVSTAAGGLVEATFAPNTCVPVGDADALAAAVADAMQAPGSDAPRLQVLSRYTPERAGGAFAAWIRDGLLPRGVRGPRGVRERSMPTITEHTPSAITRSPNDTTSCV